MANGMAMKTTWIKTKVTPKRRLESTGQITDSVGKLKSETVVLSRDSAPRDRNQRSATSIIAHALLRNPDYLAVRVSTTHAEVICRDTKTGKNVCVLFELSTELKQAIAVCNAGGKFEPGRFRLEPPTTPAAF